MGTLQSLRKHAPNILLQLYQCHIMKDYKKITAGDIAECTWKLLEEARFLNIKVDRFNEKQHVLQQVIDGWEKNK